MTEIYELIEELTIRIQRLEKKVKDLEQKAKEN
jgi:polyhydroxyalkanoate synthesis regulator phasin